MQVKICWTIITYINKTVPYRMYYNEIRLHYEVVWLYLCISFHIWVYLDNHLSGLPQSQRTLRFVRLLTRSWHIATAKMGYPANNRYLSVRYESMRWITSSVFFWRKGWSNGSISCDRWNRPRWRKSLGPALSGDLACWSDCFFSQFLFAGPNRGGWWNG